MCVRFGPGPRLPLSPIRWHARHPDCATTSRPASNSRCSRPPARFTAAGIGSSSPSCAGSGSPTEKSSTRAPRGHRRGFARRQPGTVPSLARDDTSQAAPTSSRSSLIGPALWMMAVEIPRFSVNVMNVKLSSTARAARPLRGARRLDSTTSQLAHAVRSRRSTRNLRSRQRCSRRRVQRLGRARRQPLVRGRRTRPQRHGAARPGRELALRE